MINSDRTSKSVKHQRAIAKGYILIKLRITLRIDHLENVALIYHRE